VRLSDEVPGNVSLVRGKIIVGGSDEESISRGVCFETCNLTRLRRVSDDDIIFVE